jgi:hypothetical protein
MMQRIWPGSPDAVRCKHCGEFLFLAFGPRWGWEWDGSTWLHRCESEWHETVAVHESPIGFTGEMVRAILDGRKVETRRLPGKYDRYRKLRPGDVLYAREAWQMLVTGPQSLMEVEHTGEIPKQRPEFSHRLIFKAHDRDGLYRFRPGMHMAKWMSRIRLVVTEPTRREPVCDIDDAGALREGVTVLPGQTPVQAFERLWDSIHPHRGERFADGPYVRKICFRRVWP